MEEAFLRFSHLAESIFENLDNQNLSKCREVGQSWKSFIDCNNLVWIRIQKEYPLSKHKFTFLDVLSTKHNLFFYQKDQNKMDSMKEMLKEIQSDLHLAALTGQTETFKILFEENFRRKKNLETPSYDVGMPPFYLASGRGNLEVCRFIIEKIGNPSTKDKFLPYRNEILSNPLKMAEMLKEISLMCKLPKQLQDQSLQAFDIACWNRHEKVARFLLKNASILKLNLARCFKHSCIKGNTFMAEIIINTANEIAFDFNRALQDACFHGYGNMTILKLLIGRMDIEKIDATSIFHTACHKGLWKVVRIILNSALINKINFNKKDEHGWSAFHNICSNGRNGFAECLIEKSKELKIDLNSRDNQGMTGFHLACKNCKTLQAESPRSRSLGIYGKSGKFISRTK